MAVRGDEQVAHWSGRPGKAGRPWSHPLLIVPGGLAEIRCPPGSVFAPESADRGNRRNRHRARERHHPVVEMQGLEMQE